MHNMCVYICVCVCVHIHSHTVKQGSIRGFGKCIIGRNLEIKVVKLLVVMGGDFLRKSIYSYLVGC